MQGNKIDRQVESQLFPTGHPSPSSIPQHRSGGQLFPPSMQAEFEPSHPVHMMGLGDLVMIGEVDGKDEGENVGWAVGLNRRRFPLYR